MTEQQAKAQVAFPLGTRVKQKVAATAWGLVCGWTTKGRVAYEVGPSVLTAAPDELDVKP